MRNIVKLTKGITTVQTPLSFVNIVIVLPLIVDGGGGGGGSSLFWIYVFCYHREKGKTQAPSWYLWLRHKEVLTSVKNGLQITLFNI